MIRIRSKNEFRELEKAIGYTFRRKPLLKTALTHPSHRFENDGVDRDNQRMEFLGDAVLGFVSGATLYSTYKDEGEGLMTSLRSRLTSGRALAKIAKGISLGDHLRFGKGEARSGGHRRPSNLADALEAIIGAAYLDGGVKAAEKIYKKLFVPIMEDLDDDFWGDNPKGQLQEVSQRLYHVGPTYKLVSQRGPSHSKIYRVEVELKDGIKGAGEGRNKRLAESKAAEVVLQNLRKRKRT
tara:strand:+ start:1260 stop:1976 length:717 start_codon:yes stop_codon:yes gene_type:complete